MGQQVRTSKGRRAEIKVRKTGSHEYEASSESKDGELHRLVFVLTGGFADARGLRTQTGHASTLPR